MSKGSILSSIGDLLRRQRKFTLAREKLREALNIGQTLDDPKVAIWLNNMAVLHAESGDLDSAKRLFIQALDVLKRHHFDESHMYVRGIKANISSMEAGEVSNVVGFGSDTLR